MYLNSRGAFAYLFLEKRDKHHAAVVSPTVGASRVTGSGPGCHPPCEEQREGGETSARCLVTKAHTYSSSHLFLAWALLSFPLKTVPAPGPSYHFSTHQSPSLLTLPALSLLLSFPSPYSHCSAILSSPCPLSLQLSLIFPPFLSLTSHLHPIQLPLLISFPFPFNSVQAATSLLPGLSGIQGHGGDKPCALRPGSALPSLGRSCMSLHWSMLCADTSFGVPIKKFEWASAKHVKIRIFS